MRQVRMYNPTHRFDDQYRHGPSSMPNQGWSYEFQDSVNEVAVWGDRVYVAVGTSVVAIDTDGTEL